RDVDQDSRRSKGRENIAGHQPSRAVPPGNRQHEKIGPSCKVVQSVHVGRRGTFYGSVGEISDVHVESACTLGDGPADTAIAGDAQTLAADACGQADGFSGGPVPTPYITIAGRQPPRG